MVKLRPYKVSTKGTLSNRPPNRQELALFTPFLLEEIQVIQPHMLVTLGNTALHAVAGEKVSIGDCHGQVLALPTGMELFPLYHPASIIYNRSLIPVYDADLLTLKEVLSARGLLK